MTPPTEREDFISTYLAYTAKTECPTFFHRWTGYTCLAAWLGRSIYLPFGHFKIHANMYVMLVGLAGTKKSTAIKIGSKLLVSAGYKKFAANKTRQEKFLADLADGMDLDNTSGIIDVDTILEQNLFGDSEGSSDTTPREVFVNSDEINNFIGTNNLDFMSILGDLWDYDDIFKYKLKNATDVIIPYPTINLLGGNTFAGFNRLFPPEAIEQGFFSRLLFIYAEPTGVKYTIPEEPSSELQAKLINRLNEIRTKVRGKVTMTEDAYVMLDKIYKSDRTLGDMRFDAYENRRLQHLLKLCMLIAAASVSTEITLAIVIEANTVLSFTENLMPKALGEFGKARNSGVTHKIMEVIDGAELPITFQDMWKAVYQDLDTRQQLAEILGNLTAAEKIQSVADKGYLPIRQVRKDGIAGSVDWSYLTKEERGEE